MVDLPEPGILDGQNATLLWGTYPAIPTRSRLPFSNLVCQFRRSGVLNLLLETVDELVCK